MITEPPGDATMSEHDQVQALHLDHFLTLKGVEKVEDALRPYLHSLKSQPWRPRSLGSRRAHFADRPGWWWRVRIIEWSGALKTRRRMDPEALRAFSGFVRDCSEEEICDLVRGLVQEEGIQESA
jgi:hypothetical protein